MSTTTTSRYTATSFLLVLLLCSIGLAANNFSSDPNCVLEARCESGALGTDSSGTGNHLNPAANVTADTVNYQQGSASADFSGADDTLNHMDRSDAQLSSDFPFKSTTDNHILSACFWFRMDSTSGAQHFFGSNGAKDSPASRRYHIRYASGTGYITFAAYSNGLSGSQQSVDVTRTISTSTWYHLGVTYNDNTGAATMRLYDSSNTTVYTGSTTFGTTPAVYDGAAIRFSLGSGPDGLAGSRYPLNGQMDEVVVFNDTLTADEIDSIRAGTYPTGATGAQMMPVRFD